MKSNYIQTKGEINISAPSNIAIVKYWGKTGIQIPVNPSISFSLKNAKTHTYISFDYRHKQNNLSYDFFFEEKQNTAFEEKLKTFFSRIESKLFWLNHFHLIIKSNNTFPHSSGIASSASSYAALALGLAEIHKKITGYSLDDNSISEMARLGSGSAARSIYLGWNTWGESKLMMGSSNEYASHVNAGIHPSFESIQDTILIVNKGEKQVSSTIGHSLMDKHPFKDGRIKQAHDNLELIMQALKDGDWNTFIEITELEALSLHGLMMSSSPSYTLLEPNSLEIIKRIRDYREKTGTKVGFTIDAGPNIHLLYPYANKAEIIKFINKELVELCDKQTYIMDEIDHNKA